MVRAKVGLGSSTGELGSSTGGLGFGHRSPLVQLSVFLVRAQADFLCHLPQSTKSMVMFSSVTVSFRISYF